MVGNGAMGQVFGLHLQEAGVELAFYARPESAATLKRAQDLGGLPLFQVSRRHRRQPVPRRLTRYQVLTTRDGCRRFKPDQIWFTTPSTVYYSAWFREFVSSIPSQCVVCFAPEAGRTEFIPEAENEDRFVFGGITLIAWQGDLAGGGGRPEGVNFWRPPLLEIPIMGAEDACLAAAEPLKRAGLRVGVKGRGFYRSQASITAVMTALVAGLELSDWSLAKFRRGPWLKTASRGAREAVQSQFARDGILTRLFLGLLLSAPSVFLISLVLPLLTPFDLECYLAFHYHKTRYQSLALLALFIRDGERQGRPMTNLRLLLEKIEDGGGR